jgi:hypothetical protein
MQVFGAGGGIGSQYRPRNTEPRKRRAGWWFWGPLIWGGFFFIGGIAGLIGAVALSSGSGSSASGGITIAALVWLGMGLLGLAVAWYAWRDIHSDDAPPAVPGQTSEALEDELRTTGVPGHAEITNVKYLAGSTYGGTTLVELTMDVTTATGGTVGMVQQVRVPTSATESLGKGSTVPVVVSTTNPSKMIVKWEALLPPAPAPPAAT